MGSGGVPSAAKGPVGMGLSGPAGSICLTADVGVWVDLSEMGKAGVTNNKLF